MRRTWGRSAFWLGLFIWFASAASIPALADLFATVDVTGDTVIGGVDGSHLFGMNTVISSDPDAFPYEATFTFDLSDINTVGGISTAGGGYTVPMTDATFTAFGQSYSFSDPGTLNFLNIPGDNGYSQTVSNGVAGPGMAGMSVGAFPTTGNPITNGGAAQSFSFEARPYAGGGGSFLTFAEGDTSLIANVDNISYLGPGCSAIVSNSVTPMVTGQSGTGKPYNIMANFSPTPTSGLNLTQAANDCGYTTFDWQQLFSPAALVSRDYQRADGQGVTSPLYDPQPGGWTSPVYCNELISLVTQNGVVIGGHVSRSEISIASMVAYPLYYFPLNIPGDCGSVQAHETSSTLQFFNSPADPYLTDNETLAFNTCLVGVDANNNPVPLPSSDNDCFNWTDNYTGLQLSTDPSHCSPFGSDPFECDIVGGGSGSGIILFPPLNSDISSGYPGLGTGGIEIVGQPEQVPEPPTMLIFSCGIAAVCILSRRKLSRIFIH